jgi:hypothetical protein
MPIFSHIIRVNASKGKPIRVNVARPLSVVSGENAALREMSCEVSWHCRHDDATRPFAFLKELSTRFALTKVDWRVGDKAP